MTSKPASVIFPRRALALLLPLLLLAACAGGQSQPYVKQYLLEYPSPRLGGWAPLPAVVQVSRLAAVPAADSQQMLYAPGSYERDNYAYDRWRVGPGQLVGEALARDLVASRLFKAVLGPGSLQQARFQIEGGVLSFMEVDRGPQARARLELVVTLLDRRQKGLYRRVMFQRTYRAEQDMGQQSGAALAAAMSRAMAQVSPRVIKDIYEAIKGRLAAGEPPLARPVK